MTGPTNLKKRKIAVLGSRSVGKSSLVTQYIEKAFFQGYYPTIETIYHKEVSYKDTQFDCEIIDTAGQDETSILRSKHAIGIHGYILVYSTTSRNSLKMSQIIYDKIVDFCGMQDVPCVIVGSKSDLTSSRQVETAEVEKLAKQINAAWIEISAKENVNIERVFELCLGEIERRLDRNLQPPKPPQENNHGGCYIM